MLGVHVMSCIKHEAQIHALPLPHERERGYSRWVIDWITGTFVVVVGWTDVVCDGLGFGGLSARLHYFNDR